MIELINNPQATRDAYGAAERAALNPALAATARADLRAWSAYQPTPLMDLPGLAQRLGVARVVAKYEGARTELASFKALGGAYALSVLLARALEAQGVAASVMLEDLESGRYASDAAAITVTCASDGNHGRSLAWGAQRFGCRCVIYLPSSVSAYRAQAIARYGARVVRVDGNYDDAVRTAAFDAAREGWMVVADTATQTYREPPQLVMAGYSLLMDEAFGQLDAASYPTHIVAQVGCGGLAAVAAGYVWSRFGAYRPVVIGVEPLNAACLLETVRQGDMAVVGGEHETVMGGLACGEVSHVAWEVLKGGLDFAMAMPDRFAIAGVRGLARGEFGPELQAGESGAAGVGALLALAEDEGLKARVELNAESRVMLVITEGATDPEQFEAILSGRRN